MRLRAVLERLSDWVQPAKRKGFDRKSPQRRVVSPVQPYRERTLSRGLTWPVLLTCAAVIAALWTGVFLLALLALHLHV